ncbi:Asp23/Gls24 family envelope stress response protein [Streptomyces sp. B1866]|uniref:Asp23/Gls24 family envelope stress response protein n=1 Tax=Streptomyces sp. B1866 TaxID=3075431 RepID=UPI00288FC20D|nr:Asp23/Gls24 family envelope stress response protein [Streptomyces sp. B1866]MDT3396568.1 Asp23/Gls24 family envelope stress response protein [Streptomyces sp. B1866]
MPTETTSSTAPSKTAAGDPKQPGSAARGESLRPPAERGRTTIADSVVEKIAGMAAREVPGVHALGGSLARTLGAVRDRVPGSRPNVTRGVKVEVGERQTAVDLDIVVEYGVPIADVAVDIRESVIGAVERMTALEVVEVNISVIDVRLPDDEDDEPEGRVQ